MTQYYQQITCHINYFAALGSGVGPHQWDVPFTAFTPSLLRVRISEIESLALLV